MTAALTRPSDHCFDWGDLWMTLVNFRRKPGTPPEPTEQSGTLTAAIALDLIFGELKQEADRPIRDRLNEVLRQWYWRHHPKPPH